MHSRRSHTTIIESHQSIKLDQTPIAYYVEIIVMSSYALRNMGNYSQLIIMNISSGIMNTTQSENITSPPNNLKYPSTSMY